mgnify:CR=1 FL=1
MDELRRIDPNMNSGRRPASNLVRRKRRGNPPEPALARPDSTPRTLPKPRVTGEAKSLLLDVVG